MSRPQKEPTKVITIPVDRIKDVERVIGRPVALNQVPVVKIRATGKEIAAIRKVLK